MSDPITQIARGRGDSIVIALRAVGANTRDRLDAAATMKLAVLIEGALSLTDGAAIEDAIIAVLTIAKNPHLRVVASTVPPPQAEEKE